MLLRALICLGVLLGAGDSRAAPYPDDWSLDLHAHWFIHEGVGPLLQGQFPEPARAEKWNDRFKTVVDPQKLWDSGVGLAVLSFYANPVFKGDLREAVRQQIRDAREFVKTHPEWKIVRTSREAREALASGKRAIVFSLEGASGILDKEEDLQEFVDREGIRIVTPLHFTDDWIGGVALMKGAAGIASPLAWIRSWFAPNRVEGVATNLSGLTPRGKEWIRGLAKRGVWIDLSHASDRSQQDIRPVLEQFGQPPLYTHTVLRKYHGAERGLSSEQLQWAGSKNGWVGLIASQQYLGETGAEWHGCRDGLAAFAAHYRELTQVLKPEHVALGSDANAPLDRIPPTCDTGTVLDQKGLVHFGWTGELWKALRSTGAPVPLKLSSQIEAFLNSWENVEAGAERDLLKSSMDHSKIQRGAYGETRLGEARSKDPGFSPKSVGLASRN